MILDVLVDCISGAVALFLLLCGVFGGAVIGLLIAGKFSEQLEIFGYWIGAFCLGLPLAYLLEYIVLGVAFQ